MDEAEGVGGDSVEQFHRNEAISAVTDEAFVEEDDDYEDLYNDVNVGEGFFQSMRKNEDLGFRNEEETRAEPQPPPPASMSEAGGGSSIPGVGRAEGEAKFEGDVGMGSGSGAGRVDAYQSQGFRGNDMGIKGPVHPNGSLNSGPGAGPPPGVGRGYGGLRVELGQQSNKVGEVEEQAVTNSIGAQGMGQPQQPHGMNVGNVGNEAMVRPVGGGGGMNGTGGSIAPTGSAVVQVTPMVAGVAGGGGGGPGGGGGGGGGTLLFVGDLHWWTTDAELEAELVKYGPVKEVKFFDEKASGKSKGYCQVEFYDPGAATTCKEGMNGHVFNGRPCVVAFASPHTIKRMGEAQVNRTQQVTPQTQWQGRGRGANDANNSRPSGNNISTGGNYQGGDQNRNFMRGGNWGRGNPQGMGGRGPVGPIRNRPGGMGGRGIMGNGGNGFGQGMGPTPPLMPPQAMMGQGFDPGFGGPMGRMGNFGGFPGAPTPPFQGLLSSFPPVGNVGLPGVAPHVNPAFFGRGMPMNGMNGMGMMPNAGVDGPNMGMWSDPNMGGWAGDEHGGRAGESSYGEEAVSDHQYGEASHDRGGWQNPMKDKDRGSERDFSGSSDRRYRDEREPVYDRDVPREKEAGHDQDWSERRHRDDRDARDRERSRDRERDRDRERSRDRDRERDRDRDRYKEDRDRYSDHHRYRDRETDYDDEWERGRSSRTHSKSRVPHEEERSRSRDADYGKRRRITSE